MAKRYNLKSEIQRVAAKHPKWELQLPDVVDPNPGPVMEGQEAPLLYRERIVQVLPAQLYPDNVLELTGSGKVVEAARVLLGDAYDHMVAAGGSASLFFSIANENAGAEPGESSASSAS